MLSAATALAQPYTPSPDGEVVIEAEHFDSSVSQGGHDWVSTSAPGSVGDVAMQAGPDSGVVRNGTIATQSPRLDFEIEYQQSSTLNVWIRGIGPNWNADSIWVAVDGNASSAIRISVPKNNFGWVRLPGRLPIAAGVHTISVWMREDGVIVDRLFLSPLSTVPAGDGPPESQRGSGNVSNTWPVANDDLFTVINDGTDHSLNVLADNGSGADFDPDGDSISVVSVTSPGSAGGGVAVNGSANGLIYTPLASHVGTESFEYTIGDETDGRATATVTVDALASSGGNSPPSLDSIGDRTVIEGQSLSFVVTASDSDSASSPSLRANLDQLRGSPGFSDNGDGTGSFSWTPSPGDAPGPYTVTFTAVDASDSSLTSSETIAISVERESSSGVGAYQPDGSGRVVIEAENYDLNVGQGAREWVPDFTSGFVGESAMISTPNSWLSVNSNIASSSPRLDYAVEFASQVTLNVWVRGLGLSGSRDSVWIGIDGDDSNVIRIDPTRGVWGWETAATPLIVPASVHTINVWMREDGTIIDRLLLTPLSGSPTGVGPTESQRSGGGTGGPPPPDDPPPGNNPPSISGQPQMIVTVGDAYSFVPTVTDTDNDSLTFSVEGLPAWLEFDPDTGAISGTPGTDDVGEQSAITITVSDGLDSAVLDPFSIMVNAAPLGSATLSWTPPTQNTDGSPLTDLAGYKVFWTTTPGDYENSTTVLDPAATSFSFDDLPAGTYEFAVKSLNSSGLESDFSNPATKRID